MGRVEGCLRRISGNSGRGPVNTAEWEVGRLHHDLNYLSADEIIFTGNLNGSKAILGKALQTTFYCSQKATR